MAGPSWPLASDLTDDVLEAKLFVHSGVKQGQRLRQEPDWSPLSIELKKPGVRCLSFGKNIAAFTQMGMDIAAFASCSVVLRSASPTRRQEHVAGDKVFVDYSGKKVPIVDRKTGEIRDAELFLNVLGASSYTYAEATWTQTLPDWIGSHVRMFTFFDGVPRLIVPDNLKSGVNAPASTMRRSTAATGDPPLPLSYAVFMSLREPV